MQTIYDIIGVGIGPFNLGLAALSSEIKQLKTLFFDKKDCFNWHTGMMIDGSKLQVPFHADLVTLANPQSSFSFLCYLKAKERLIRFTIREEYFPLRKEYNDYCRWVAGQLDNLRFGHSCKRIEFNPNDKLYAVQVINEVTGQIETFFSKKVVVGVGTVPWMPDFDHQYKEIVHSSQYLHKKDLIQDKHHITIIGSGQSAAEIFSDLLEPCFYSQKTLSWLTRSNRFFPMDYSKFALEMTSPDYIDYFFDLSVNVKEKVLKGQSTLFKGMNTSLIDSIYNRLYGLSLEKDFRKLVQLRTNARLMTIDGLVTNGELQCTFKHRETRRPFQHKTQALVLATGYHNEVPECILPLKHVIQWDKKGRYRVNRNYSIDAGNSLFVQNAELHTHGFNAPDLGMGPYRNAIILNTVMGEEYYKIEKNVPFQSFL